MSTRSPLFRQTWTAIRALLILTVVLGLVYPAVITVIGQVALNGNANGQLVRVDGEVVGSAIIGQSFTDADGAALPEWFQSRPSAAGAGYDGAASSGSNYGPENEDLVAAIGDRQTAIEDARRRLRRSDPRGRGDRIELGPRPAYQSGVRAACRCPAWRRPADFPRQTCEPGRGSYPGPRSRLPR